MIVFIIILVIVLLIAIWLIGSYNSFVRQKNSVEEAFSTMDVYLKKRFDMIPNLVETVKGYASHEKDTLEKVVNARNATQSATTPAERLENENVLTGALRSIFALSESYPDLKANQNFLELQTEIQAVEEDIASSRKYYNAVVKQFNNSVMSFPSNIIANMFHFEKQPMFEVADAAERENVKVQF